MFCLIAISIEFNCITFLEFIVTKNTINDGQYQGVYQNNKINAFPNHFYFHIRIGFLPSNKRRCQFKSTSCL
jgi:hypothetical protein